jgi:hypothetical protein
MHCEQSRDGFTMPGTIKEFKNEKYCGKGWKNYLKKCLRYTFLTRVHSMRYYH